MKELLTNTENAKAHLIKQLTRSAKSFVMLQAVGGGCAGYKYKWSFLNDNEVDSLDTKIFLQENKNLIIDRYSAMNLIGLTIDYVESISGASLELINPNAKSTCGCGESFS